MYVKIISFFPILHNSYIFILRLYKTCNTIITAYTKTLLIESKQTLKSNSKTSRDSNTDSTKLKDSYKDSIL